MKIVIVGASFAGVTAAINVKKMYGNELEVYLIEQQNRIGFLPGAISLYFNKKIQQIDDARFITEDELTEKGIHLMLNTQLQAMDTRSHSITIEQNDQSSHITYDKLILATGSTQWSQKIIGNGSSRLLRYKQFGESEQTIHEVAKSDVVAVIGGGQIGSETTEMLLKMNKKVHLFESMNYLLFKYFDYEMIEPVQTELENRGAVFHFEETVERINENSEKIRMSTLKASYQVDAAIFGVNIRPELTYLDERIAVHTDQTIFVDKYLATSEEDVFAIGDCISIPETLNGEPGYIPLVNNAVRTGIVAAQNLFEPTVPFIGSLRTVGTKIAGYYIASTGLTEGESIFHDHPVETVILSEHPFSSINDQGTISAKLVFDKQTKKVLGAQLVSKENILGKINTLALSIQSGQTIMDLAQKDYFYHSDFSPTIDIANELGMSAVWSSSHEN